MSIASTAAKQRWNKLHYSEIKASLDKELVAQFKAKCRGDGASIASVLATLMFEYCGKTMPQKRCKKTLQHDTRPKRRKMASIIAGQIDDMLQSETEYRENIPQNLYESIRAESADYSIEKLGEALDALREAY
jgi:hypothetical protein